MLENRKTIQKTRRRGDIEIKQAKRAYTRHVKPERIIVFVLSEPNTHLLPLRSLRARIASLIISLYGGCCGGVAFLVAVVLLAAALAGMAITLVFVVGLKRKL
jgi:hypothetical protein